MAFRTDKGETVSYTGTAANGAVLPDQTSWVYGYATTDCFVVVGDTATATTTAVPVMAFWPTWIPVAQPQKGNVNRVSAIRKASSGDFCYIPWTE